MYYSVKYSSVICTLLNAKNGTRKEKFVGKETMDNHET